MSPCITQEEMISIHELFVAVRESTDSEQLNELFLFLAFNCQQTNTAMAFIGHNRPAIVWKRLKFD